MVDKTRTPPPPLRKIPPREISRPSGQPATGVVSRGAAAPGVAETGRAAPLRRPEAADATALRRMMGSSRRAIGAGLDPVVDTPAHGITRSGSFTRIAENLQIEDERAPLSPEARRVLEGAFSA